jgi:ribosomal protein S15P/S13E
MMDHKLLLQLLQNKTEEIQSLLNHFKSNPDDLSKGLHLLSDRIEGLSKEFQLIKDDLNAEKPVINKLEKKEIHVEETKVEFPEKKEILIEETKEEIPEKEAIVQTVVPGKMEEVVSTELNSDSILNDQLQQKSSDVIGEKLIQNKISDIQSAIGINDRFLFIRELFENNPEAYNSSINFINRTENYELIEEHFKSQTNWDFENPTVIQFMELTKRKF